MTYGTNVFDRSIRHQQSVLNIEVQSVLGRAIEFLPHAGDVFRMNPLDDRVHRGLKTRRIPVEDSKSLVRPYDFSTGYPPAETAGVTEFLGFRQIRFPAL